MANQNGLYAMSKHAMIETEVGYIPEDWEVVNLGKIGPFYKGAGISREDSHSGSIPAVRYGELYTIHNNYIFKCTSFISPQIAKQSRRMRKGYILFTGSGETKEDIGKAVAFLHDYEAYAGGDLIILSPKKSYDSLYLGYILNSSSVIRQRTSMAQGDSVVHITADALKELHIPLPPTKDEQTRIASALYDIDTLIRNLDRTIEKKKNIRQGAMEELLSGKRKAKGYNSLWRECELSEIINVVKGVQKNGSELLDKGPYPMINGGVIPSGYTTEYNTNADTITISEGGNSCGYVNYVHQKFWAGGHCYCVIIRKPNEIEKEFLFHLLKYNEKIIMSLRVGSGLPNIQSKILLEMQVYYPTDIKEQQAIADTLTAMDDEIATLQLERDKYANIRSGMMDALLSGIKRM